MKYRCYVLQYLFTCEVSCPFKQSECQFEIELAFAELLHGTSHVNY
jgi:hypothetical protein